MRCAMLVCLSILAVAIPALAQDLPMVDYSYNQGFEEGDVPVQEWVSNGAYDINFMGITDEKAHEGTHSFKLDITIKSGSYHYFHVPLRVPLEGEATFSGWFFIESGDNSSATLGVNLIYPPTTHSGVCGFNGIKGPTGEWKQAEGDLVEYAATNAEGIMARYVDGATGAHVGKYLDRWALYIKGGVAGDRVVVYVDDISIEGRVPDDKAYQAEFSGRWTDYADKWTQRIAVWRDRLTASEQRLAGVPDVPEQLTAVVTSTEDALAAATGQLDTFERTGYARASQVSELEARIVSAEQAPAILARIRDALDRDEQLLAFEVPAMSNARIFPGQLAIPGGPVSEVAISACAGEYESTSLVLFPLADVTGLMITPTDLTGADGTIPAAEVDVKFLKVWYQAGRSIGDLKNKQLVPELLLNDSALVRVDPDTEQNYLRSTAEDGTETYVLASDTESAELGGVRPIDADTLQPIDLPALNLQQYWVTVHVPDDLPAGEYTGSLQIAAEGAATVQLPMTIAVHPFDLEPSPMTYSVYYRGRLTLENEPTITSEHRSNTQYLAEMRHLAQHGILHPTIYQAYHEEALPRALNLREEAGLATDRLFCLGVTTGSPTSQTEIDALVERVKQYKALAEEHGYEKVYFYGVDEASGDRLLAQRAAWKAVQDAGGFTFVAGYKGTFEAMGALLNVAVLAHAPIAEEAVKFHGVGSEVFTYAFPQVGPEEAETFRRNYGLHLWKAGFDGAMDYAYQHGFGHVWNDFDSVRYRDHNFAYPTVNGVIGTVQIEGSREATDDVRYLATLLKATEECKDDAVAEAARQWVEDLDPARDLYVLRAEMVDLILRCKALK